MQLRLQAPGSVKATLALPGSLLCSSRWRAALLSGLALYQSGQTVTAGMSALSQQQTWHRQPVRKERGRQLSQGLQNPIFAAVFTR